MPKDYPRSDRIAQVVSRGLANLLRFEVNDDRVTQLSVVDVSMSPDLRHADVFVFGSQLKDDEEVEQSMRALRKASKFLRHRLSKTMDMRRCPELHFKYDHSIQRGADMSALIESLFDKE